jgi:hypothetical protein
LPKHTKLAKRCKTPKKMGNRFLIFLFVFLFCGLLPVAAQNESAPKEMINAIKTGDFSRLADWFDAAIDLTIPQNGGNFSKKQASLLMKHFFDHNPPKSFSIQSESATGDGSIHIIGSFTSKDEKRFMVYVHLKKLNDKRLIKQLKFE